MKSHIVMEGNAFYEIDEECVRKKQGDTEQKGEGTAGTGNGKGKKDTMALMRNNRKGRV